MTPTPRKAPADIMTRLLEYYTPAEAALWWTEPQKLLDGRRACDCPDAEALRLLDLLDSGAYL